MMKMNWTPTPLSKLAASEEKVLWLLHGYIAAGAFTLFAGLWKAGKTTFLSHLLRALEDGQPFANLGTAPSRVLVVTEEAESMWRQRRDELTLGDHIEIISRPFLGRPDMSTWEAFVREAAKFVKERKFTLVVFDSLPNLSPVKDENDAAQTIASLMPLYELTKLGAAVVLVMHPRKGDATEGQAARGSGATPAFVDIIVEMRRHDPERRDTRRTLTAYSRFDETPSELVLDYESGKGYRALGTQAEASAAERLALVEGLLPKEAPGWTVDEILDAWPKDGSRPGARTLKDDLCDTRRVDGSRIKCVGKGVKGDPYRYYLGDNPIPASSTSQGVALPECIASLSCNPDVPDEPWQTSVTDVQVESLREEWIAAPAAQSMESCRE